MIKLLDLHHADTVCQKLGFDIWIRAEAFGYSGGICVLWKNVLQVEILKTYPQFIHMQVTDQATQPMLL